MRQSVDNAMAGDCKMMGDIDGDGDLDVAVAGSPNNEPLTWYRYPDWQKTVIAQAQNEWSNYGVIADVDLDGDGDIVLPDGIGPTVFWFENPGDTLALTGSNWIKRSVGNTGTWCKDVFVSDYDKDGLPDISSRPYQNQPRLFFRNANGTWTTVDLEGLNVGQEGLWSADVDGDGDEDLITQGQIALNPSGTAARTASNWTTVSLGIAPVDFKAFVADLNGDGRRDVLFSSSEGTEDVVWFQQPAVITEAWTRRVVYPGAQAAHTLWAADVDVDGDQDVVIGAMQSQELIIMENTNGNALSWTAQVIDNTTAAGIHNGQVGDIDLDGDPDIFGAGFTGQPAKTSVWLNQTNPVLTLDSWTYIELTNKHEQTFGVIFADMNRDGLLDVVSGGAWYRNPGGDLSGTWPKTSLPTGMKAVLAINADSDVAPDILATRDDGSVTGWYWLEPTDATATAFSTVNIGSLAEASHELGAQGHRYKQVIPGGKPEILTTAGDGIWYFTIPTTNPGAGSWPKVHVTTLASDEELDAGDIDRDGHPDIVATTGNNKQVQWYKNPGTGAGSWVAHTLGTVPEFDYPDRCAVADLNGDGRLDVVVTEENAQASDAQTFWWEQPLTGVTGTWTRHNLTTQASTNSMDVADMDRDGDADVILAEHRGSLKIAIWENSGTGTFTESVVGTGKESHYGAQAVDLDNDGDKDLVSIAYDAPAFIHLWRNDASQSGAGPDLDPPHLISASAPSRNQVLLEFNEAITAPSAVNPSHYSVPGLFIGNATLDPDNRTVRLTTSSMTSAAPYAAVATLISDLANPANVLTGTSSLAFTAPGNSVAGLIHHWPCDDDATPATAEDVPGDWDATLAGARYTTGHEGEALGFNGSDRANLGNVSLGGTAFTLALWFKADQLVSGSEARFVSKASSTSEDGHYWMLGLAESGASHKLRARLRTNGTTTTLIAGITQIATGTWYHAALIYDGVTMKLYLDGGEVASTAKAGAINQDSSVPVAFGAQPDGSNGFSGSLDDIRIYSIALTPADLTAVINPTQALEESYSAWAQDLDLPGPNQDNDNDGAQNLIEFLSLGNASVPDADKILPQFWTNNEGTRIGLLIRDGSGQMPVLVEASSDLFNWAPLASFEGFSDVPAGEEDGVPLRLISAQRPAAGSLLLRLRTSL